jgi:hypothetical protein
MPISTSYNPNAPQAKLGQGSAISNREDLSNELTILAPEETPILSLCAKGKANSTFKEWTVDSLSAPVTTGIPEGSDVNTFSDQFADRARLGNYVQTFRRDYLVSNIQQAVNSVGPANIAQAEAKAMRSLKRDAEATIASSNEMSVENGAGTPYAMRGLGAWIDDDAQSVNPVPVAYRTPAGSVIEAGNTLSTVSESNFNSVIGSIFARNGEMNSLTLVANVALRQLISGFTRATPVASGFQSPYNINQDSTSKTITLSVNLYDSDFGVVKIVNGNPACMPTATTNVGYLLNPKYLGFDTLIPMGATRLENQGGGERGYVDMTGTLVCKHPQAHGKIAVS